MIKFSIVSLLILLNLPFLFTSQSTVNTTNQNPGDLPASIKRGQTVYSTYCVACHQATGLGMENVFPPLAKSDYLMADTKRTIHIIMYGKSDEITVNGKKYNGVMPEFGLKDEEITDVLNYIRNSWGNKGKIVTLAEIKTVRNAKK